MIASLCRLLAATRNYAGCYTCEVEEKTKERKGKHGGKKEISTREKKEKASPLFVRSGQTKRDSFQPVKTPVGFPSDVSLKAPDAENCDKKT
jgi:hypothetical protein